MRLPIFLLMCLVSRLCDAQSYSYSEKFSRQLQGIISACDLDSVYDVGEEANERISFAVIDLTRRHTIGGVNMDNFIYPASVYKMYVAMEVLRQVSRGDYNLNTVYVVRSPNDVDKRLEISFDPRPLLTNGDSVTINYLLDLMITRSDNTAANCLIDVAGRKNINQTMLDNGWKGSEVTRKFLKRVLEDPGYDTIRGTQTNARHAAEFMYKMATNQLVDPWVSMQLKALLGRQLDKSKLAKGLPANVMFSHKTGWWSFYTNDVGIAEDGRVKYVVALFTPVREANLNGRMHSLAEKLHALILEKHNY